MESLQSHIAELFSSYDSGNILNLSRRFDMHRIESLIVGTNFNGNALQIVPPRYSQNQDTQKLASIVNNLTQIAYLIKSPAHGGQSNLMLMKTFENEKTNPLKYLSAVLNDFSRMDIAFDEQGGANSSSIHNYLHFFTKVGKYMKSVLKIYFDFPTKPNADTLDNLINELRNCFVGYKKSGFNQGILISLNFMFWTYFQLN
jgi:hypothetical protein